MVELHLLNTNYAYKDIFYIINILILKETAYYLLEIIIFYKFCPSGMIVLVLLLYFYLSYSHSYIIYIHFSTIFELSSWFTALSTTHNFSM